MNEYDGLVFEQSVPGRVGYSLPEADVPGGRSRAPPAGGAPPTRAPRPCPR